MARYNSQDDLGKIFKRMRKRISTLERSMKATNEIIISGPINNPNIALKNENNIFTAGQTITSPDGLVLSGSGGKDLLSLSSQANNVGITFGTGSTNIYRNSVIDWLQSDSTFFSTQKLVGTLGVVGGNLFGENDTTEIGPIGPGGEQGIDFGNDVNLYLKSPNTIGLETDKYLQVNNPISALDAATKAYVDDGISVIEFYGHSGVYGGASAMNGTDTKTANFFNAEAVNRSRGGARLAWHEPATAGVVVGGWAHLYRYLTTTTFEAPYDSNHEAIVLWFGLNDLAQLGPNENLQPFTDALYACISRARAASIFEETHASVTYPTGTWSNNVAGVVSGSGSNLLFASGGGYKSASSGSIRVAVPSDFPGGTVALSFLAGLGGTGASMTFTVDGVNAGTLDTRNRNAHDYEDEDGNPNVIPMVKRFTNLSAGAHTIVATVNSVVNACLFDCWWIESPNPPIITVLGGWQTDSQVPLFQFYELAGFPYVPDATTLENLNQRILLVCASFFDDEKVIFLDIDPLLARDPINFAQDHIHLSDRGHTVVATAIANTINKSLVRTRGDRAIGMGRPMFISSTSYEPARNVIESVNPLSVPLTLKGRKAGDQITSLLRLDGSGSHSVVELGRNLSVEVDAMFGVRGSYYDIMAADAESGDVVLRSIDGKIVFATDETTGIIIDGSSITVNDGSNSISMGNFGVPYLTFNGEIAISQSDTNELTLSAGDHIISDDPEEAQHLATKNYVDGEGWQAISFANNWGNVGSPYSNTGYYLKNDRVFLRGAIIRSSGSSFVINNALPAAYRPVANVTFLVPVLGGMGTVTVGSDGIITVSEGTGSAESFVSLEGISWRTV